LSDERKPSPSGCDGSARWMPALPWVYRGTFPTRGDAADGPGTSRPTVRRRGGLMAAVALPLPAFSESDPLLAGEGSLDPLGLAQLADRLAEHLLPGIRARMRRIRFLTVAAVGAAAVEDLWDRVPADGVSSPAICFEWLVLEAFARCPKDGAPLEASGVPGSTKVKAVLAHGRRLAARNYLKSPNVFGFTGVYLPLARHLHVLDGDRLPGPNITALTRAWEEDQQLRGFTDGTPGTPGAAFRSQLRSHVADSLQAGHCAGSEGARLWKSICTHLHPRRPGDRERALLTGWLTDAEEPVRAWLAPRLTTLSTPEEDLDECMLVERLLAAGPPPEVQVRLEAVAAFEQLSRLLDGAFRQVRRLSTHLGTTALTATRVAHDPVLMTAASRLPDAIREASDRLEALDGDLVRLLGDRLGRFEVPMSAAELLEALMAHHESVQAAKGVNGKRSWFDRYGQGWVVRSVYWLNDEVDLEAGRCVHPYRLASLRTFMGDLGR
jgi:hypothetical protein